MKVAVFCEKSGIVREAFRRLGHDAWSFDLLPAEDNSPYHVQGDCRPYVDGQWDLAICHPVCKRLALSGVRWLFDKDEARATQRWIDLMSDIEFFELFLHAPIKRKCIENSKMHGYTFGRIPKKTQSIHPWEHGHLESKETCLWLTGLKPIIPTNNVREQFLKLPKSETHKVHRMAPGPERDINRARTYTGIAAAFAAQWG